MVPAVPRVLLLALLLSAVLARDAAADERWRWPVRGEVLTPFVLGPDRFAPGQHRGIDVAAAAGAPVRAACGGTVRFAGRVPGRGRGVTVVCGGLVATHLELGRTTVRRGAAVAAGTVVGTAAASHVQLGARRLGSAHGYVDPLRLLAADPPPPLGTVPPPRRRPRGAPATRRRWRAPERGPAPRPVAAPAPRPAPSAAPRPAPSAAPNGAPSARPSPEAPPGRAPVPVVAWAGLAALLAALPAGALVGRRGRRRGAGGAIAAPRGW